MDSQKPKCPKCKSENIVDSGHRAGPAEDYNPKKEIESPNIPLYTCKDCGESAFEISEIF